MDRLRCFAFLADYKTRSLQAPDDEPHCAPHVGWTVSGDKNVVYIHPRPGPHASQGGSHDAMDKGLADEGGVAPSEGQARVVV